MQVAGNGETAGVPEPGPLLDEMAEFGLDIDINGNPTVIAQSVVINNAYLQALAVNIGPTLQRIQAVGFHGQMETGRFFSHGRRIGQPLKVPLCSG